jgi:ribonuclease HI
VNLFLDHVGNFVVGFTQRQHATMSTLEGETWTLLHAMKEVNHRGFDMVQFESDSHVLIEVI